MHLAVNNFGVDGKLDFDIITLSISALLMLLAGIIGLGGEGTARAISVLVGLAFAGYAFYLTFVFTSGTYIMPIYAYLAPILVIVNLVRSRNGKKKAEAQAAAQAFPPPPPPPV
jgi:hypothetical protein